MSKFEMTSRRRNGSNSIRFGGWIDATMISGTATMHENRATTIEVTVIEPSEENVSEWRDAKTSAVFEFKLTTTQLMDEIEKLAIEAIEEIQLKEEGWRPMKFEA